MKKKLSQIFFLNIVGINLLISYALTYYNGFWFNIDSGIFHFFNQYLDLNHKLFLYIAAITNHRTFDVISFLVMALIYYSYFRKQTNEQKRRMIAIGITMLLTAVAIKQFGRFIPISHPSPTRYFETYESINRVSQLTHFGTKDSAGNSFPGDHGMMLMIFTAFIWRYLGLRAFIKGIMVVVIFSAPRIIVGAHWFTDVYVGSLAICCITLSWLLLTPASDYIVNFLLRFMPKRLFPTK
ncbi:phosphatase PAP2 family protein [Orbaceae bacterium ac157xtp]